MSSAVLRSPRVRDAAAALAWFAAGLLVLRILPDARITWWPAPDARPGTVVAVLAIACAGEVLRRRLPLAGLLLASASVGYGVVVLGHSDVGTVLVFADLLYCAVLYSPRTVSRGVCLIAGGLVTGLTIMTLVVEGGRSAFEVLLNLLILAVPVLWAAEVRRHRELADIERSRAAQASRMAEMDRQAAVAAERARMARDLHDIVAGQLSAIALQSEAALDGRDPELRERVLRGVRDASVSALSEMRTMIGLLRESEPDGEPRTAPARLDQLEPLLTSARAWGLEVRVADDRPAGADAAAGTELAAYRIVQEGLTNVAKHAPGAHVTVHLRHDGDRLEVLVENGPSPSGLSGRAVESGTGLVGLAERAEAVGGTVHAGPSDGGWRVAASLPLSTALVTQQPDNAEVELA